MRHILLSIAILFGLALVSCVGPQAKREATIALHAPGDILHCIEDRRPSYKVLEMPPIRNTGNAPQPYLEALYDAIQKQIKKREVWQVVSERDMIENVVVFNISMLVWEDASAALDNTRHMKVKLSLVDKFLGCEINETTGAGQVVVDSSGNRIEHGVADIADRAGWFVENVLIHNQSN